MSTTWARAQSRFSWMISATTVSPGSAPLTNTTRPSVVVGQRLSPGGEPVGPELHRCHGPDGRRFLPTTVLAVALPIQIAPSVLPADFSRLGDEVVALEKAGVDLVQWDVMDGQFVPNLTFGPDVIASVRDRVTLPFEAHLMVLTPDAMAARYVEAGCSRLIVHAEACEHLHRTLGHIAELGASAGVAINPATPVSAVAHVLDLVDVVLVMTVNPGFGGSALPPHDGTEDRRAERLARRQRPRRDDRASRSTAGSPSRPPPAP